MDIVLIAFLTIVSSGVGTLTGFGSSTIMLPVLMLWLPFSQALLLAGVVHFFVDIWKLVLFKHAIRWKLILLFGIPGVLLSYAGARLAFVFDEVLLSKTLGIFLILYTIFLLTHRSVQLSSSHPGLAVLGGTLSGFFAGIFGVGGAIRSAFLAIFNLPKEVYISTAGAIALFVDVTRIGTYVFEGTVLSNRMLYGLLLFIPASLVGAEVAKKFVKRIPQKRFRQVVAAFLFVIGISFLI